MSETEEKFDLAINTKKQPCPIPSMRLLRNIRKIPKGGILKMSSGNHNFHAGIHELCSRFGHKIISRKDLDDGSIIYYIQRKGLKL